ncbi:AAEL004851-PA, partial [Aedes aegypti]
IQKSAHLCLWLETRGIDCRPEELESSSAGVAPLLEAGSRRMNLEKCEVCVNIGPFGENIDTTSPPAGCSFGEATEADGR